MKKILVTPRSLTKEGDPALDLITGEGFEIVYSTPGTLPQENELIKLLPGCVGYLAGVEPITAAVLESAVDLKVISRNGTGINTIDLEAAQRLNIEVLRAEGANARGVAELTLGVILSLIRSIPFSDAGMKRERWERRKGLELQGRTLGLIGCGKIGQLVCRLALAFGMEKAYVLVERYQHCCKRSCLVSTIRKNSESIFSLFNFVPKFTQTLIPAP